MMKSFSFFAILMASSAGASTVTVTVDAKANSSTGGVPFATGVMLTLGQLFTVSAGIADTWTLGDYFPYTRETNADGLTNPYFGTWTQSGLTARFGSLVGQVTGTGTLLDFGTSYSGLATAAGELFLYSWDQNYSDNSGSIDVTITTDKISAVPLPAAGFLLIGALGGLTALRRRKQV